MKVQSLVSQQTYVKAESTNLFQQINARQYRWLFINRTENILHFFRSDGNVPDESL